jgi:hypothetical protein
MMLLGIDWFVVEGSRRKAAIRYKHIFVSNYPPFFTSTILGVCCSNQIFCNISFNYRKN